MERSEKSDVSVIQIVDSIRSFQPTSEGYEITFQKHAARYKLKSINPGFEKLESILKKAEKTGTPVRVSINAVTLEILNSSA